MALLVGALWLCSCDLIVDKIREGGANRPGGGGASSGPTPPPSTDAGVSTPCRSSSECGPGLACSTEWGVCNSPPGCRPEAACPAVCYGFCDNKPQPPLPTDPPPPPPSRCKDWTGAGDETTCKTQSDWKLYAYEACQAQNLILNDYGVGGGDCGPGMTRQVKYQCCAPAPSDPGNTGSGGSSGTGGTPGSTPGTGTPGTGSSGGGGSCTGGVEGSDSSCKSAETWRQYAMENCARQNQALTEISLSDECGAGLYRYMKFVCCGK